MSDTNDNKIKVGDKVCVEFTDGKNTLPGAQHIVGILTKDIEDDLPYCEVDGKGVDLCSEGHSSRMHKLEKSKEEMFDDIKEDLNGLNR